MSFFDNLIGVFSPERAYRREAWNVARETLRNYDAGKNDRLNDGWRPNFNESAQTTDKAYRDTVRARARDLERNSDIAGSMIRALERNVVGKGITLQAKLEDDMMNDEIERLFKEWCKPRNCDVSGQHSFQQLLRMIVRRRYVDGGILIVKSYTSNGIVPFQLQLLEVDEIDSAWVSPHYKGNSVVDGVEINSYGKPQGYWIKKYLPDGSQGLSRVFIPVEHVIFYYYSTRPTAVREISAMAPTISRIRDINSYMEAVSVKERIAACFSLFIERSSPVGQSNNWGRGAQNKDGGYSGMKLTPGMIMEGMPGDKVTAIAPAGNGGSAADFVRVQQRLASAGQGLSYEAASRDLSQVNYSSARQGLIEDEGTYSIEQQELVEIVLNEIYETFIISAVLSGKLNVLRFWENKREYMRHIWVMPAKKWIDPLKETNANRTAMETYQKTLADVCAEQGEDWKDKIREAAEIEKYMKEVGLIEKES